MKSTLFKLFGIPIRSYGLMMVVGFALGLWRAVRVGPKRGIPADRVYDLALISLLSGVIGARIAYILLNLGSESFGDFISVWNGGLSFHGGLIAAVLAGWIYTKRVGLSFLECADLLAPSVAIGYAITRIGCFLNGCCYGAPTSLPWGVRFREDGALTPPSHPTQIYAMLANLAIFCILTRIEKLNRRPGFVFLCYVGLYSVYRFLIEFLRAGYSAKPLAFGLTEAQVVSLITLTGALVAAWFLRSKKQG